MGLATLHYCHGMYLHEKMSFGYLSSGYCQQDPELRKKFEGTPEHVINFFYYLANDLRKFMAKLGFRTINEMVGRTEKIKS